MVARPSPVRAGALTRALGTRFTRPMRTPPPGRLDDDPGRRGAAANGRRARLRHPKRLAVVAGLLGFVIAPTIPPVQAVEGTPDTPLRSAAQESVDTAVDRPRASWSWPVAEPRRVVREFLAPEHQFGAGHRGIDIAAAGGAAVRAPAPGVVLFAGPVAGRSVVTIDHGGGVVSSYDPIVPAVTAGDVVTAGGPIGALGPETSTHCPGCLHLGVRRDGAYVDPAPFFRPPRRSILLPLGP